MADHITIPDSDDPLDAAIRRAAPVRSADLSSPPLCSALTALATEVADRHQTPLSRAGEVPAPRTRWFSGGAKSARRRGQRRFAGLTAATALMIGGVTAVGAATGLGLWSGWFDSPSSSESVAGEEYVNVASPRFAAEFDRAALDYPLPAGVTYARLKSNVLATGGLKQLTGMRGEMALYSTCPWIATWLRAASIADTVQRTSATNALARIAQSRDLAAIDGGGIVSGAQRLAAAAAKGNRAPLSEYHQSANCGGGR